MTTAGARPDGRSILNDQNRIRDAFIGCLLGTAVGDSLGLPYEGLSPRRAAKMFPNTSKHHFLFGKGMVSDDTEHACFVAQALIRSNGDVNEFQKQLARSLRWWILGLPAGIGFATLRSIINLWLGKPPSKSGVFSAGNGPAMRSPILGVAFGHDPRKLKQSVKACTEITHSDPKAYYGALAIALAAYQSASNEIPSAESFQEKLGPLLQNEPADEFLDLVARAAGSAGKGESISDFAQSIGTRKGISGYIYHTVPCVLHVWFRNPEDFDTGIQEIIAAGGDSDTTAAILGGIIGARVGKDGIPVRWLSNIVEWPRSTGWMERLAIVLAANTAHSKSPAYFAPAILIRNVVFFLAVLAHGFRRLAPPY